MRRRGVERNSRGGALAAVVIAGSSLLAGIAAAACASAQPSAASTGRVEVREAAPGSAAPGSADAKSSLPQLRRKAPVQLLPGREALVEGTDGRVRFVRVIEDSRCPRGVTCAWAGRARVEIALRDGLSEAERKVELEVGADGKDRVDLLGQTVVAAALEPHPTAKSPKPAGDTRLRLVLVEKTPAP